MESKKQARTLQKAAKEFGYEIKLTHAQEILAKVKGFENRHALFKSEETTASQDKLQEGLLDFLAQKTKLGDPSVVKTESLTKLFNYDHLLTRTQMFYFEVHIFFSRKEGYSKYFSSDKMLTEEEIITEAINKNIIDSDDAKYVDYTEEISESEYKEAMNY
jgi:hypothetical protein